LEDRGLETEEIVNAIDRVGEDAVWCSIIGPAVDRVEALVNESSEKG
jgi:hypothetical protein